MTAEEVKALIKAHKRRDEEMFQRVVDMMIANAQRKGQTTLSADLRRISGAKMANTPAVALPVDRDSRIPLATLRTADRGLADVILNPKTQATVDGIVSEVHNWVKLDEAGIKRRNRALLFGPPGCGKTVTVEAIASALGRELLIVNTESLINSHLGNTGSNLAEIFKYAATDAYVVFFDEFDSIGKSRDDRLEIGEMRRVVNSFLQLVEAYDGPSLIIAATNHDGALDSALWRRFDFVAELPLPTVDQIGAVLRRHIGDEISESVVAQQAHGLVGHSHAAAEYAGLSARRFALFDDRASITEADLSVAVEQALERRWA